MLFKNRNRNRNKDKKHKGRKRAGLSVFIIGIMIASYPILSGISVSEKNAREMKKVESISAEMKNTEAHQNKDIQKCKVEMTEATDTGELNIQIDYKKLYSDLYEYNQNLLNNGQVLAEQSDYEEFPVDLNMYGLESDLFGYIQIPSIHLKLPLYLGSKRKHLSNGAAVMGNTSAPIGGTGTNSVIVAHNGWNGIKRFIKCEELKEDDLIYITNFYETICYKVTDNFVTTEEDMQAVLISGNEDLITLVTCYPYTGFRTKERLIVRAERTE